MVRWPPGSNSHNGLMAMSVPTPGIPASAFSEQGFAIRATEAADAAPLVEFGAAPGVRYVCYGSDAFRYEPHPVEQRTAAQTIAAVVAVARNGDIVGMARLANWPGKLDSAELTVAANAPYERLGVVLPLLLAIGAEARAHRLKHLTTSVQCQRGDPFDLFRQAGMRAESWFGIGGATEVVLAVV